MQREDGEIGIFLRKYNLSELMFSSGGGAFLRRRECFQNKKKRLMTYIRLMRASTKQVLTLIINTHVLNVYHWLHQDKHLELLLALVSVMPEDISNRAQAF